MICWSCRVPPQNYQVVAQDTTTASPISAVEKAQILSAVIASRFRITRDSEPYIDGCSIRRLLGTTANGIALLRADVRQFVLASNPADCSGKSEVANSTARLIFKHVTADSNGAVVECAFTSPWGAHVETYKLRKYAGRNRNSWAVTEIQIFDFATI